MTSGQPVIVFQDEMDRIETIARESACGGPPLAMVNLNQYKQGAGGIGGEGHSEYMTILYAAVAEVGGRILWRAPIRGTSVGSPTSIPHEILLIWYPSHQAFAQMIMNTKIEGTIGYENWQVRQKWVETAQVHCCDASSDHTWPTESMLQLASK